jgi:hypothetical protein
MTIIDQLYLIYLNDHLWITDKLPKYEIDAYHRILISRGNIITEVEDGKLLGYVEVLKVTPEQFGRMVLDRPFSATEEDSLKGDVAVVFNVWIEKKHRNSWVVKILERKFFEFTKDCKEYAGIALRKLKEGSTFKPVKIFKKERLDRLTKAELWAVQNSTQSLTR